MGFKKHLSVFPVRAAFHQHFYFYKMTESLHLNKENRSLQIARGDTPDRVY